MKTGDLVKYWFARKYPVFGLVIRKWEYPCDHSALPQGTYIYSVEIMENNGQVSAFDIHVGDQWEVISEGG